MFDEASSEDEVEDVVIGNEKLQLPAKLCSRDGRNLLDEMFSLASWNAIPSHVQERLVVRDISEQKPVAHKNNNSTNS